MKKWLLFPVILIGIVLGLVVLSFLVLLGGTDTYEMFHYYPECKATRWHCEELDFEIVYTENEYGNLRMVACPLEWNGETYMLTTYFGRGHFFIQKTDDQITIDDRVLEGDWEYRGNKLVLIVEKDAIFDGAFEELVFIPIE